MKTNKQSFAVIKNGTIASPSGFKASGIAIGLKKTGKPDIALIYSEKPAIAAGSFTTSLFASAPVQLCRNRFKSGSNFRAVIVNSGNANACTGEKGYKDACEMAEITASSLKISANEVLVSSTGRIGIPLPMETIRRGIIAVSKKLSEKNGNSAANAIMTTDTKRKQIAVRFELSGKTVTIGAMAKGSGMIAPKMATPHATMLVYITTDANLEAGFLRKSLAEGVDTSFNRISVDNDTSTNDTVIILANGMAGNKKLNTNSEDAEKFRDALFYVMRFLAKEIVLDGEGATKFVTVSVKGAKSVNDAEICAKSIANSMLCKTAWFGGDPNWGRVLAAAGYSGAVFNPEKVSLHYDSVCAVRKGRNAGSAETELAKILKKRNFTITLNLNSGAHCHEIWTSDISYEYVKINADYHT